MEISKKQIELITLRPNEGMYLTRKDRKDNEEVILSKQVVLGKTDTPENWMEIAEAEGEKLRDEVQARLLAEAEAEQERKMRETEIMNSIKE